jgi:DNA-binding response OmpR family regulator
VPNILLDELTAARGANKRLREQLEESQEENRQLRAVLFAEAPVTWRELDLTPSEEVLLRALFYRDGFCAHETLDWRLRAHSGRGLGGTEILKVIMCRLRTKLRGLDPAIEIGTVWGRGYVMTPENKALLAERQI